MPDPISKPADEQAFDQSVRTFELAWESDEPPSVIEFVRQLDLAGSLTTELLAELCVVDMEYRWRQTAARLTLDDPLVPRPRLRDYERVFEQYAGLNFDSNQFAEEYRVRRLWGDAPTPDQFLAEFPIANPQLLHAIRRIDRELAGDNVGVDSFTRTPLPPLEYDPRAPLSFTDFTLHELIGAGGMGKVYRATQRSLHRNVAVKALAKSLQRDPLAVDRFVDEARTLARLHHPNIVGVYGLGRFPGGGYFLVMEYIAGQNLEVHRSSRQLAAAEVVTIVSKLAHAIEYAHSRGVIHCDLKPTNVLLATDKHLLITDFGFAELMHTAHVSPSSDNDRRGGTLGYTAPEWLEDDSAAPLPTIDVYGLGAILGKLLERCPTASTELADIRDKALSRNPADRYQSAGEFAAALRRVSNASGDRA